MSGSKAAKAPTAPGSTRAPAPADHEELAPSMAAAHYAAETACSFPVAAARFGVTPQAVHDAFHRAFRLPARKPGRPRSAAPRTHTISTDRVNLRASDEELAAYRKAAGDRPLPAWLREICGPKWRRIRTPEMRRLARAAAGLPEE